MPSLVPPHLALALPRWCCHCVHWVGDVKVASQQRSSRRVATPYIPKPNLRRLPAATLGVVALVSHSSGTTRPSGAIASRTTWPAPKRTHGSLARLHHLSGALRRPATTACGAGMQGARNPGRTLWQHRHGELRATLARRKARKLGRAASIKTCSRKGMWSASSFLPAIVKVFNDNGMLITCPRNLIMSLLNAKSARWMSIQYAAFLMHNIHITSCANAQQQARHANGSSP